MNPVPLKKEELLKAGILHAPATLYKWHSEGTHKEIFVKICGRVGINADEYFKLIKKGEKND